MNAGILPILLIFAAAGLTLSFASSRAIVLGVAAVVLAALASSQFVRLDPHTALKPVFLGLWISMIATVGLMHLRREIPAPWAVGLGLNVGMWAGLLASISLLQREMAYAFPILLIAVPGKVIVTRRFGIAVKVVGSWIVAIAILAIFVSLTPTPGYEPDHMQ